MYCNSCGKKIMDGSRFCNYCGSRVGGWDAHENAVASVPEERKFCDWGNCDNGRVISEINAWLSDKPMIPKSLRIQTRLSEGFFWRETSINHMELNYVPTKNGKTYRMGFFISKKYSRNAEFSCLEQWLDEWKENNPDTEVVYSTRGGHQYGNASYMTLYYLYAEK